MKLATTTADFSDYVSSQKEALSYVRQAGFRYADYNFGMDYRYRNGVYGENWHTYIEDIKRAAEKLSVQWIQSHAPMGAPIASGNKAFVDDTIRCIEACGALGIDNIVVHSGYEKGLSKEETFERNLAFYRQLIPAAERYQVNLLVENFDIMCLSGYYWIDNAPDLREFLDDVNHPLIHACWDAGHGNMQPMMQDEALRLLGRDVLALHIQDNVDNIDLHMAPMFGSLNVDSLMHGLLDIGYQGYFTFEACNFFTPVRGKKPFEKDDRLLHIPLSLKLKAEAFLYEIGKFILTSYNCFEE